MDASESPRTPEGSTTSTGTLDARAAGLRIASLRRANGWSQRRLAEAAGVSHGYIALLELGRLPSPGKLRLDAVARALSLRTADALMAPQDPMPDSPIREDVALGSYAFRTPSHGGVTPGGPVAGGPVATSPVPGSPTLGSPTPGSRVPGRPPLANPSPASATPGSRVPGSPTPANPTLNNPRRPSPAPQSVPTITATVQDASHRTPVNPPPPENTANVLGPVEQVRGVGARPLPVFRWGACGDPRDQESGPDPDRLEYPPPGRETLIGSHGFGVVVKGDSMAARGIYDGDVVWVNPERAYAVGKVVLAQVSDVDGDAGEAGMVVKTYARTEVGDCLLSETASGRSPLVCREFKVIGPVVGITSWRLPT